MGTPIKPFDGQAFTRAVTTAITEAVRAATEKAMESAVEDAPVRSIFFKGSSRRKRGLRRRSLTLAEANSENYIRRKMANLAGKPAVYARPGVNFTAGRRFTPDPYLRLAATRKGNLNSFAPFTLRKAVIGKAPSGRQETLVEAVRGGREVGTTPTGGRYLLNRQARAALDSGGRRELKTGRALFTKDGVTTLGGRLRGSITMQGPTLDGGIVRASVVSPVYYSKFQEFGTRHNRATPYMRPAIAKMTTTYRRDLVKAIHSIRWR